MLGSKAVIPWPLVAQRGVPSPQLVRCNLGGEGSTVRPELSGAGSRESHVPKHITQHSPVSSVLGAGVEYEFVTELAPLLVSIGLPIF